MSVLLTGSTGFLGQAIKAIIPAAELITLGRHDCNIIADISVQLPILPPVNLVIHVAGKAHLVPKTENDKYDFYFVNVIGTQNLLKALEQNLPESFVFISSVAVYGKESGNNINEENELLAKDAYGLSKIEAEKIILEWCKSRSIKCTILRLPLIVGKNPPGNLGSMINGIRKGFYFNIDGGDAKKSMVLATDVAKFILKASEVGGTYNLTDGFHPTFNELSRSISQNLKKSFAPNMPFFIAKFLAKIGDIFGNNFPINSNKLAKITSSLTFNDSKARTAFGWKPTSVLVGFKLHENV